MEIDTNEGILIVMNVHSIETPVGHPSCGERTACHQDDAWFGLQGPLGGKLGDILVFSLPLPLQDPSKWRSSSPVMVTAD